MILKKDLLEGLDLLTEQVFLQGDKLNELEHKLKNLESKLKKTK